MVANPADQAVIRKRAVRHVLYASDGHDRIHILFSLPPEDAGLGFLAWRETGGARDQMWLFMPGYRSVRRLPASERQKLAGTDLIYEDVRELAGERTELFTYENLSDEQLDGRLQKAVMARPKPDTSTAYSSRKILIDSEWHFPTAVEYYDDSGKPWKRLRNSDIREVAAGVHRAGLTEMRDLQRNRTTLLLVTRRDVGLEIPPRVFTQDYLVHPGND